MNRRSLRLVAALIVLGASGVGLAPSAAAADPEIAVGSGHSTDPGTPVALTGVTVDDGGLATLRVRLEVQGGAGTLTLTELTGLSFDEGDGDDDPAIEVRGTEADLNAAFATLVFNPDPAFEGEAKVEVSVTDGTLAHDGHYYEYVPAPGITWEDARDAAAARSFYGRQGYLATITSPEENAFAAAKLTGEGWIGARAETIANRQHWRWVTGPEAEHPDAEGAGIERGLPFYLGSDMTLTCIITPGMGPVGGQYSNWLPQEPNNCSGEYVAHFVIPSGMWNDYAPTNPLIDGYVVEYGDLPTDTPTALPSATATISVRTGVVGSSGGQTSTTSTPPPTIADVVDPAAPGTPPAAPPLPREADAARARDLAFTGGSTGMLAAVGAALMAAGAAMVRSRRARAA